MAQTTDTRITAIRSVNSVGMNGPRLGSAGDRRKAVRRVSIEQEKADFAAWLREYRRWTQRGCGPGGRGGDIEWGGEDGTNH